MKEKIKNYFSLYYGYYYEIIYLTSLILFASVISYKIPQKRLVFFVILGIHFLSLYLPCCVDNFFFYVYKKDKKTKNIYYELPLKSIFIISNILLIIAAIFKHVFIYTILVILISMVMSFLLGHLADILVVEDDTILFGDFVEKYESFFNFIEEKNFSIMIIFHSIPTVFILLTIYLNNYGILISVVLLIAYIIFKCLIIYLGEEKDICSFESLAEIFFFY